MLYYTIEPSYSTNHTAHKHQINSPCISQPHRTAPTQRRKHRHGTYTACVTHHNHCISTNRLHNKFITIPLNMRLPDFKILKISSNYILHHILNPYCGENFKI